MSALDHELASTSDMSAEDLEKLAMKIADLANAKRQPRHGNRAFTFVTTHFDCTFAHPVFYQKVLPTNAEAAKLRLDVSVLHSMGDSRRNAKLLSVVHNAYGHPVAWVSFDGGSSQSCTWDSEKRGWRLDPD